MPILSQMPVDQTLEALAAQLGVPTITGLQHQGDVSVVPASWVEDYRPPTGEVPRDGVVVVRGEHTHLLMADPGSGVVIDVIPVARGTDITVACLHVPDGSVAWLDHPEHGDSGIGPGTYVIRRKREEADGIRIVAD